MNYLIASSLFIVLTTVVIIQSKTKLLELFIFSILTAIFCTFLILPDYYTYWDIYLKAPSFNEIVQNPMLTFSLLGLEPGYVLLNSIFSFMGAHYFTLRFFIIFAVVFTKMYVLFEASKSFLIASYSYFAFYMFMDLFILRQSIASAIIAVGILQLMNRNERIAWVLFLLAPFFHVIALLALPLPLLVRMKLKNNVYVLIMIGALFVGVIGFASLFTDLFIHVFGTNSFLGDKIFRYSMSERANATGVFRLSTLVVFSLIVLIVIKIPKFYANRAYYIVLNSSIYAFLVLVLFNDFGILGDRGYRLLGFPIALLISYAIYVFKEKNAPLIVLMCFFIFVVIMGVFTNPEYILWA